MKVILLSTIVFVGCLLISDTAFGQQTLPGTEPLQWTEDYVERNNRFITQFLDKKITESETCRAKYWRRDFTGFDTYSKSVETNRERLKFIIGVRDNRAPFDSPELINTLNQSAVLLETGTHTVLQVRWKVFDDFSAEGLLIKPKTNKATKTIIHLPHSSDRQFHIPASLAKDEQMFIPLLLDREPVPRGRIEIGNREYIYRSAYQLGRHIIGYEVQEILALVDWAKKTPDMYVKVQGQGDGGLLAFYAAAVDTRIDEAIVVDYFDKRDRLCEEPIDRNVFGLLKEFGDAEIATLICPRKLTVALFDAPELTLPENNPWKSSSKYGGAPGKLKKINPESVKAEIERAKNLVKPLKTDWIQFAESGAACVKPFANSITEKTQRPPLLLSQENIVKQMDKHNQRLLTESVFTRRNFWKKLDTSSPQKITETVEWYRDYFSQNVVGEFEDELLPIHPRTRFFMDCKDYTIYEIELDVFDGLTAFGFLLVPKTLKDGQKLPAVVGQHGLEVDAKMHIAEFSKDKEDDDQHMITKLCSGNFVTFAPQGIFKLSHRFRFNQRQLNSLGKNLFAVMTAQHKQIVKFLQTLPFVEKDKIGFYGCSYGGTTAMFVPPLIPGYKAVVCSANFNYWNDKVAGTTLPSSYMFNWEYEIFDFDLANTFDHSDMARLIAPRPFMVERGHNDGVAWSENVAFEFGKVRYYYDMYLKMPDRAKIIFETGGHSPFVKPHALEFLKSSLNSD